MVKGIGTDILEISRIEDSLKRHNQRFLDRLFTKEEQEYCLSYLDSVTRFAGRFAAKEAIAKALGRGFGESLSPLDIIIKNDEFGKPQVKFSKGIIEKFKNPKVLLSISHCHKFTVAMAIWT